MYTLRVIEENGVVSNVNLGNEYRVIDKEKAPERFNISIESYLQIDRIATENEIFAFVSDENLKDIPLYKHTQVFIMTYKGHTISRLR